MPWISVIIKTDSMHVEALSDAMLELGALSTDIHDSAAGTEHEQPLFGEPGEPIAGIWLAPELTALFKGETDIPAVMRAAAEAVVSPATGMGNPAPARKRSSVASVSSAS